MFRVVGSFLLSRSSIYTEITYVSDPNPDPYPRVFVHPDPLVKRYGSGSGSFHHHEKIVRKTLNPTIL
jgi:hypothetical protein